MHSPLMSCELALFVSIYRSMVAKPYVYFPTFLQPRPIQSCLDTGMNNPDSKCRVKSNQAPLSPREEAETVVGEILTSEDFPRILIANCKLLSQAMQSPQSQMRRGAPELQQVSYGKNMYSHRN